MKILVVENNMLVAEALACALSMGGHCVVGPATKFEDLPSVIGANLPNLALIDIQLEGKKTGIDCARMLRLHYHIPTIFLSAHADQARKGQPHALGYLEKPVTVIELLDSIRAAECILQGRHPLRLPSEFSVYAPMPISPSPVVQ